MPTAPTYKYHLLVLGFALTAVLFNAPTAVRSAGEHYAKGGAQGQRPEERVAQRLVGAELLIQNGHTSEVKSLSYSPDGRFLVSGGRDKVVKLWDMQNGRLVRNFENQSSEVNAVTVSSDGSQVAVSGADSTIRLWDTQAGNLLQSIKGHTGSVNSVFFSPLGSTLLSGGDDGILKAWDARTGKLLKTLGQHSGKVVAVAFSPDGRKVASAGADKVVKIWDYEGATLLSTLRGHSKDIRAVVFSPDARFVASAGEEGIKLWDILSGTLNKSFAYIGQEPRIKDNKEAADGRPTLKQRRSQDGSTISDPTYSIAFSPDGRLLAEGGTNGDRLWDTSSGELLRKFRFHIIESTAIAFSPDGLTLTSGSYNSDIKSWDVKSGRAGLTLKNYSSPVNCVAVSPDGRIIASASGMGSRVYGSDENITAVHIWDSKSGRLIRTLNEKTPKISALAFSPDSGTLFTSTPYGGVKAWDLKSGTLSRNLLPEGGYGDFDTAFSPDAKVFASVGGDSLVRLLDAQSGELIRTLQGHKERALTAAFSPDGRLVASGGKDRVVKLWDVRSGKHIRDLSGHTDPVFSLAFSPDGRTVSSGGLDKSIKVWDVQSGKLQGTLEGHAGVITSLRFTPDGRTLASSGGADESIKLWNPVDGRLISTLKGHLSFVADIAFSPDGQTLISSGADSTVKLWSLNTTSPLASLLAFNDGNWISYTPSGHYAGSDDASKYITWRVGNQVYDFDQFFEKFFKPEVVAQVIQGKKIEAGESVAKGFAPPPDVRITSPQPGMTLNSPDVEVSIQAKDMGGGVAEVRLYQNGKLVDPGQRGIGKALDSGRYRVSLVEGDNVFRAMAFSRERVESRPHELTVRLSAPVKGATLRLLSVGINKYQNSGLNLNFAAPDARGITEYFKAKGSTLFREIDAVELYDAAATRENIVKALRALQSRTLPQDVVVIYLAGHGDSRGGEWYFITHELTRPEMDEEVAAKGLSSAAIAAEVTKMRSQKMLLILDACKAGSVLVSFRGYEDRRALAQLARSTGIHVIAASTNDQLAAEVKDLGHGVFTYLLLKGLNGEAKLKNSGAIVTVRGLLSYLEDQLPEVSKKYRTEAQYPVSSSKGMDFPIALSP